MPQLARHADGEVERARVADGVDGDVDPAPVGRRLDRRARVLLGRCTGAAPKPRAISRRASTASIAMTCAAPAARAAWTAHSPTGPRPSTATLSPGRTGCGRVEAGAHHVAGEERDVAGHRPPGTRRRVRLAWGTSACSACVPCRPPRAAPWPKVRERSHLWKLPARQARQMAHATWKQPRTRSPTATERHRVAGRDDGADVLVADREARLDGDAAVVDVQVAAAHAGGLDADDRVVGGLQLGVGALVDAHLARRLEGDRRASGPHATRPPSAARGVRLRSPTRPRRSGVAAGAGLGRVDFGLLRRRRDFRLLVLGQAVSGFGSDVTFVAMPFQMYELTGSSLAVGLLGVAEFAPIIVLALVGGALADAFDRRRLVQSPSSARAVVAGALLVNAPLPDPHLWVLYVCAALLAAFTALRRPPLDALMPRLVERDELKAASALQFSFRQHGDDRRPGARRRAHRGGRPDRHLRRRRRHVRGLARRARAMRTPPPPPDAEPPSCARSREGLRYAGSRQELLGTYLVDMNAMFFGMPMALFPAIAKGYGGAEVLGLLYAAPAVGSIAVTLTSGWTRARAPPRARGRPRRGAAGASRSSPSASPTRCGSRCCASRWRARWTRSAASSARRSGTRRSPTACAAGSPGVEMISWSSGPLLGNAEAGAVAALAGRAGVGRRRRRACVAGHGRRSRSRCRASGATTPRRARRARPLACRISRSEPIRIRRRWSLRNQDVGSPLHVSQGHPGAARGDLARREAARRAAPHLHALVRGPERPRLKCRGMGRDDEQPAREGRESPVERLIERRRVDQQGVGRPLSARARQTQRSVEVYLKSGVRPRWMERLADIDEGIATEKRRLARSYRVLHEECRGDARAFARRWRAVARSWPVRRPSTS